MGIFDIIKGDWYRNDLGEYKKRKEDYGFILKKTFLRTFKITKAIKTFNCSLCEEKKKRGNRKIEDNGILICHNCIPKFIKKFKSDLKELDFLTDNIIKEVKQNEKNWTKDIILGSL